VQQLYVLDFHVTATLLLRYLLFTEGLKTSGIKWYITGFDFSIEKDLDAPIGLEVSAPAGTVASMQIHVNGYQLGKFFPQIWPQTIFPFPPGIINHHGKNTLSVSV
jgi:Beta-galactosidase jelly roll domain